MRIQHLQQGVLQRLAGSELYKYEQRAYLNRNQHRGFSPSRIHLQSRLDPLCQRISVLGFQLDAGSSLRKLQRGMHDQ